MEETLRLYEQRIILVKDASEVEEHKRFLSQRIIAASEKQRRAMKLIRKLRGVEHSVLERYYIHGLASWDNVAQALSYSTRNIYIIRDTALNRLVELYADANKTEENNVEGRRQNMRKRAAAVCG